MVEAVPRRSGHSPSLPTAGLGLDKHSAALGHQMGHQTPQTVAAMQDQLASKAMGQKMIKPVIQRELWIKRTILSVLGDS